MKTRNLVVSMIVLLAVVGVWAVYDNKHAKAEYGFDEFCKLSTDTTSRVIIVNGSNGMTTMEDNQDTVKELIDMLNNITYKKVNNEPSTGWSYAVTLFAGDEEITKVTFISDELCHIDGIAYQINSNICNKLEKIAKN